MIVEIASFFVISAANYILKYSLVCLFAFNILSVMIVSGCGR